MNKPSADTLRKIQLLCLDVDGVLTDGGLYYGADGGVSKRFNVKDGYGIVALRQAGVEVALITGLGGEAVELRAEHLKVEHVVQRCLNKVEALEKIRSRLSLQWDEIAFMGDDVIDSDAMQRCGIGVAVADAMASVRSSADYVTEARGGHGAVREFCDLLLTARQDSPADEH